MSLERIKKELIIYFFIFFISPFFAFSHADHGEMIEAKPPYPTISMDIINLYSPDYKIEFKLDNFTLIPLGRTSNPESNEGHILILINNKKKVMITDQTYILKRDLLRKGKNEIFIMLMDSEHSLYTKDGKIIYISKIIYNK